MNYKMIALQIGDAIKYSTSLKNIDLAATSVFNFSCEHFTVSDVNITSDRASRFIDWVFTLAKQDIQLDDKNKKLKQFIDIVIDKLSKDIQEQAFLIYKNAGFNDGNKLWSEFSERRYHHLVVAHSRELFISGFYFHAVFEASKAFNKETQKKSQSDRDGYQLMMDVFSINGNLKLNSGQTQTEKNVQDGVKFLSAGLMQAVRNPTAHENAIDWEISKEDCLDLLSFISYLFKQLDKAVFVKVT